METLEEIKSANALQPYQPTPSLRLLITPHTWRCTIPSCLKLNHLFPSPLDPPTGCHHPQTPTSPLLNAHGTPIKLTAGLNQIPDRLVPVGWSYCVTPLLLRPPSSLAIWERSAITNHIRGPCRGCFVVNRYGERLVKIHGEAYLGADGKLVKELEVVRSVIPKGPLLEHWEHFVRLEGAGHESEDPGLGEETLVKPLDVLAECVMFGMELLARIAGV